MAGTGGRTVNADDYAFHRVIETDGSSSNIVVRADEWGMEVTLDPMVQPVRRIDVYQEEADAFAEAVQDAQEVVADD